MIQYIKGGGGTMATETKTIRLSQENKEQLDKLLEQVGNADKCVSMLISAYEAKEMKAQAPTRATEIDNLEALLKQIHDMYLMSININTQAEERIKIEYAAQITATQTTISTLQEKLTETESKLQTATEAEKTAKEDAENIKEQLTAKINELDNTNKLLEEKTNTNTMLINQLTKANTKAEAYDSLKEKYDTVKINIQSKDNEIEKLNQSIKTSESIIDNLKNTLSDKKETIVEMTKRIERIDIAINKKDEEIKSLNSLIIDKIAETESTIKQELKAQYEDRLNREIEIRDKMLESADAQIAYLKNTIAELKRSKVKKTQNN